MRLAPHVMLPLTPGTPARAIYERWITTVHPPVVKFLRQAFDPSLMGWTRQLGTKVVGRWVEGDINEPGRTLNELLQFAPYLDYVEYANEESQGRDNQREWDRLMGGCLDFMRDLDKRNAAAGRTGPKACIANLSVGQPEIERWSRPSTLEVARYAAANGHVWGIHEYYKQNPWAGLLHGHSPGTPDEKALWDGPAGEPRGWLMLRVVRALDAMKAAGVEGFRFIVTESGRDNIPGQPGEGGGFRDVMPGEPYAEYLQQYGRHLSALPACVGWVDFGYNAWEGWKQFDLSLEPAEAERVMVLQQALPIAPGLPIPPEPRPPEVTMLEGIDVSRWQGVMNWDQARRAGATFAYVKASEGDGWQDPQWVRNAQGAARAGIPFGPYHYYKNGIDPVHQAAHFEAVCKEVAYQLPPALDLEETRPPLDEAAFVRFCQEVERRMGRPMIYTGRWFLDSHVDGDISPLGAYPLWLAAYTSIPPATPRPWPVTSIWQYTSKGNGPALGAQSQYIDRNRFKGTLEELLALRVPPVVQVPDGGMDWAGMWAHAEHEQETRGVHLNPESALLKAIWAVDPEAEVVLGETDYPGEDGQTRVYAVGERRDKAKKWLAVWDAKAGRVVMQEQAG